MQKMEVTGWNILECSVRLSRCDFSSRGSAARLEGGVPAAPHAFTPPAASCAAGQVQENSFVVKTEDEAHEWMIKQELDIGPTVLQPQSALQAQEERGDEADEMMVKQELEIGPTVVQPQAAPRMPSPHTQMILDPRPTTSSGVGRASTPLCTVLYAPAKLRIEAEDNCYQGGSGFLARAGLMLDSSRKEDFYLKVSKECYDHFDNGDTSLATDMDRSKCCIKSSSERNPKKNKTGACVGCNQDKCHYCKYIAKKKPHLTNQTHKHMSQRVHKCKQCDYSSSHKGHLKAHIRKCTGEKPYKCGQCAYSASEVSNLKKHMRTHTGERPYKCEQCEYSAFQIGHLKVHMRIHTGEKPYKCEQCAYSASEVSNLKTHAHSYRRKTVQMRTM